MVRKKLIGLTVQKLQFKNMHQQDYFFAKLSLQVIFTKGFFVLVECKSFLHRKYMFS